MQQEIDYLFEDPPINGQTYGLVSIVGPNLQQKCNVYGIKIRGVADSLEKAKSMSQKLTKIDPDFDIYTVEIGKFFPLDVDPLQLNDVEYQNNQLNNLVKSYLENRENANVEYERRKNDMIKKAVAEGKSQKDALEHPVSLLNRIEELAEKMSKARENLDNISKALEFNKMELDKFTEEQKEAAREELKKAKETSTQVIEEGTGSSSRKPPPAAVVNPINPMKGKVI